MTTLSANFKPRFYKMHREMQLFLHTIIEPRLLNERQVFDFSDRRYIESGGLDQFDLAYLNSIEIDLAVRGTNDTDPHRRKVFKNKKKL